MGFPYPIIYKALVYALPQGHLSFLVKATSGEEALKELKAGCHRRGIDDENLIEWAAVPQDAPYFNRVERVSDLDNLSDDDSRWGENGCYW